MRHLKLALSIARSNKAFSVALFLLYSMMMALLVLVTIFNPTLDKTFETYLDEYGMPDGYVYAQP